VQLTRGNPAGFSALTNPLDLTEESYTAVVPSKDGTPPLFGQVEHTLGERSAALSFIFPRLPEAHPGLLALLDELSTHAGQMGAVNLLAEIDESDPSFEEMRRSGFSVYCWESIWKLPEKVNKEGPEEFTWEPMTSLDEPAIRSLYQTLVPPIVQSAEPFNGSPVRRLVVRVNGDLMAYVESISGPRGIYLKPVLHPALQNPEELLLDLVKIFQGLGRPVYLQMRSYQAWLTPMLEALNAGNSVHFAMMVRRLAVPQFATAQTQPSLVGRRQTETPASSIVQKIEPHNDQPL
jgi:hypothetical protein